VASRAQAADEQQGAGELTEMYRDPVAALRVLGEDLRVVVRVLPRRMQGFEDNRNDKAQSQRRRCDP